METLRRAQPGEPREPARGREERVPLGVETGRTGSSQEMLQGHLFPDGTRTPLDDRHDGGSRRREVRGRQAFFRTYYAPNNAVLSVVGAMRHAEGSAGGAHFGWIPPTRSSRRSATRRCRRPSAGRAAIDDDTSRARVHVGFRARVFGHTRLDGLDSSPASPVGREGEPAPAAPRPRRADRPGRRDLHPRGSPAAPRSDRGLGHGPAGRPRRSGSRRRSTRSSTGSPPSSVSDDELARAKALIPR